LRAIFLIVIITLFVTLVSACGSAPQATPTLPAPTDLLRKAADDIQSVTSLRFKLQLTGAPAYVDFNNTIAFVSADGAYVEPDRVQAKVVARLLGVPGEVDVVAIGDAQYMRNAILTAGRWLEQQFSPGFNAETLIKSEAGIESAIRAFFEVQMVGRTSLFGVEVYHITGKARAADIDALTVGLIRGADVVADIYLNVTTGRVEQVRMVQPETKTETLEATTWTLEIFDYNATNITIDKPEVVTIAATAAFEPLRTIMPASTPQAGQPESTPTP
jgi:hypothetical protein